MKVTNVKSKPAEFFYGLAGYHSRVFRVDYLSTLEVDMAAGCAIFKKAAELLRDPFRAFRAFFHSRKNSYYLLKYHAILLQELGVTQFSGKS